MHVQRTFNRRFRKRNDMLTSMLQYLLRYAQISRVYIQMIPKYLCSYAKSHFIEICNMYIKPINSFCK
jgi:hypothetical protein